MPDIVGFIKGFIQANPEMPGSIIYNATWLKFVKREHLLTHEQLDCKFTDALETAHIQLIREEAMEKQKPKPKRCICGAWMIEDPKRFSILACETCGYRMPTRMNSVIEPAKEKRGFVPSAWDNIPSV
jgi:hypothetical protein